MEPQLDDTQGIDVSIGVDQEIAGLLERLQLLLAEDDPRHRLLAAVASMWHDPPASAQVYGATDPQSAKPEGSWRPKVPCSNSPNPSWPSMVARPGWSMTPKGIIGTMAGSESE